MKIMVKSAPIGSSTFYKITNNASRLTRLGVYTSSETKIVSEKVMVNRLAELLKSNSEAPAPNKFLSDVASSLAKFVSDAKEKAKAFGDMVVNLNVKNDNTSTLYAYHHGGSGEVLSKMKVSQLIKQEKRINPDDILQAG